MDGLSLDILSEKLSSLKHLLPDAFTENKIDWEKLKAALGDDLNFSQERYHLNWAGKSEVFRVLQQRTSATLIPNKSNSVNFDSTENIFIEGENLEVLKVLQKSYFNKIKMIYIDPPYNTGSDSFIYPDRFSESKEDYLKRIGDKDEEGFLLKEGMFRKNSKDSGHYHSNWLSMMYPRLYLAKNLLRDDGVIFVSIDDNEVHNLRMIMNEIFGEENHLITLIWHRRQNADNRNENNASTDHEYVLVYTKSIGFKLAGKDIDIAKYKNPDNDPRGPWASIDLSGLATRDQRPNLHYDIIDPKTNNVFPPNPARGWSKSKEVINRMIENGEILFPSNPQGRPRQKKFLNDLRSTNTGLSSILQSSIVGYTTNGTQDADKVFDGRFFPFPKPKNLLKLLISQSTIDSDIIFDFFAGSGTTAHAVMDLNKEDGGDRKFILVQLSEKTDESSEAYKAGYLTIADICKDRIKKVISKLDAPSPENPSLFKKDQTNKLDLGFKAYKLAQSNFQIWRSDVIENVQELEKMIDIFDDQIKPNSEAENILVEVMLKLGYQLTDQVEEVNNYYSIADGETILVIKSIDEQMIVSILKLKPKNVVVLDKLFNGNDQLKTNTALQMKDANIELKTV